MTTMLEESKTAKTPARTAATRPTDAAAKVAVPALPPEIAAPVAPLESIPLGRLPALATPAPAAPKKSWLKRALIAAALLAALGAGVKYGWSYWQWAAVHETTDDAFIDGHVAQVTPRVAGHVLAVYAQDNQFVHKGDLLLQIDPADFQVALDQAQGKLTAAQADLLAAQSQVEQAKAQIATAAAQVDQAQAEQAAKQAELERATLDLTHYTTARQSGVVSSIEWSKAQTEVRTTQAALDAARTAVTAAQAEVGEARATEQAREGAVAVSRAQITTAQAALEQAKLNLSYTGIRAAMDGRVTKKSVEPGDYVVPAQVPALLGLVANNVWVTANFKETQLARMKPGQPVDVQVDAYPGVTFHGHLNSIQQGAGSWFSLLPPENATGNYVKVVQRVPVKIDLDNPDPRYLLGPGMSAVPEVWVK